MAVVGDARASAMVVMADEKVGWGSGLYLLVHEKAEHVKELKM